MNPKNHNSDKIPKLRFPEFKGEWIQKKYKDIFSFRTTNSYSRENLNYIEGKIKNIHYGDIHTKFPTLFDINKEHIPFINSEIELKRIAEDNYCKEGDLIIADASEDYEDVGKCIEIVNLNGEKVLAGLHTILARPDLYKMSIGFNGYLMKSFNIRIQIKTVAQGSKVLSISSKRLAETNLVIPEIKEQKRIASFLIILDKKIVELKQKKSLLEQYKKGVMQKIFSQELRFKDDKGKEHPKWSIERLGDVATFFSGGTPLTTKKIFYDGDIPFIKSGEINSDTTEQFISQEGLKNSSAKMVNIGDLLYALYGATSGEAGLSKFKGAINQAVLCIRSDSYDKIYLLNYLQISKTAIVGKYIQGGQGNLSAEIVKRLTIPTPSMKEQKRIADLLKAIDNKIICVTAQVQQTEQYKKGLLQNMFC